MRLAPNYHTGPVAPRAPNGSGAVAGSGFPLDRAGVAAELGFERPTRNSIDATGSRDFLMEIAAALAVLAVHLSRIGEELVLWSTSEFGFVILSNAANLLVLSASGRPDDKAAPIVLDPNAPMVDPLPQALILTAIVIGFGVIAYLVLLLYRLFLDQKTTNAAELYAEESPESE